MKTVFNFLFSGWRARRPNIVMILLDQFRNDMRSAHPVFVDLQKRGVLFSNVITYAPYTLASMHATFTGLYGRQSGVDAYTKSDRFDQSGCRTLVEYLQRIGYHTRGYTFSPILFPHGGFDVLKIVPEEEESDILQSHLKEIETAFTQGRPFFSYLHYGEIHHKVVREVLRRYDPFDPEYFANKERNRARYLQLAYEAGEHAQRLLEAIDRCDPGGETIIVVMTDHGGGVGEKPGEKAYGVFTYDYTILIWMYLIYPTTLPAGTEILTQIRTVDLMPTLLDLLDVPPSRKHKRPVGRSLLPIIEGKESADRLAFTETGGVEGPNPSPDEPNVKSVRDGRWKLIYNTTTRHFELYDLAVDPKETTNLYTVERERAKALWLRLSEYL
jgi:arylsulfatase A-like enzyme